mgnify:CR=1 FL=1
MVSVIVPVYNVQEMLEECILSILNQTYEDFEIILINDGSTDSSGEICDYYKAKDSRVRVIHNHNKGVSFSRNCGLQTAKGEYIAFCDSDDTYESIFLERMVSTIEKSRAEIVICGYYCNRNGVDSKVTNINTNRLISKEELFEKIFLCNEIGGFVWNKVFKRTVIKDIKFNTNFQICEDTYFVCETLRNVDKIFYTSEPLYHYKIRNNSAVNKIDNIITNRSTSKYTEAFTHILKSCPISDQMTKYVRCGIFWLAVSVKCDYLNANKRNRQVIINLNKDCKKNFISYVSCKKININKKVITVLNWMFNLRKFKSKN